MNRTIDFYEKNAESFYDGTVGIDFSDVQERFLARIPEGGSILDFGCGSGRDAKYFVSKGYAVDAIDGSEKLCEIASRNTGIDVRCMMFSDLDTVETYDGIWACASILHLPKEELGLVFRKMTRATKAGGYIYTSFKYGDFVGYRKDRYYTDFTEDTFGSFIKGFPEMTITDEWVSADVIPGRSNEKWLNVILQKLNII